MNVKNNLIDPHKKYIIAVSGGVDSMVLLDVVQQYLPKKNIITLTIDHGIRQGSKDDALFVESYCKKQDINCEIHTLTYDKQNPISLTEEYLRKKRYAILEQARHKHNATAIITAHHLNDRLETFLFRMFRGTGLYGLMSPRETEGYILRPLLDVSKEQIIAYAKDHHISWREDVTNLDQKHTRNYIRHALIPLLAKIHPKWIKNWQQLFEDLRSWQEFHTDYIDQWKKEHPLPFAIKDFLHLPTIIQTEILQTFARQNNHTLSRGHIQEILSIIEGKEGNKYVDIDNCLRLLVKQGKVFIEEITTDNSL